MKMSVILFVAAGLLTGTVVSKAAPLTVSEAGFGGEFGTDSSPTAVGTIGSGTNTISGFFDGAATGDSSDAVTFLLPSTLSINSFRLLTSNVGTSGFQASYAVQDVFKGLTGLSASTFDLDILLLQTGSNELGIYTLFPGTTRSFDYTWEIVAAQVNAPAPLALLGIGLAGLGVVRRRKAQ